MDINTHLELTLSSADIELAVKEFIERRLDKKFTDEQIDITFKSTVTKVGSDEFSRVTATASVYS